MAESLPPEDWGEPLRLGVSSCLMGEKVRFNGGHTRDNFLVHTLGEWVEWVLVCPELEMGLGVPRESLRLVGDSDDPKLIAPKSGTNHTEGMTSWAQPRIKELAGQNLHGYVLKSKSPSCGLFRVKLYSEKGLPAGQSRGIFATLLTEAMPLLPMEEEGRLNDPRLRENFIERVFAFRHWRALQEDPSPAGLVKFHTAYKLTLMAHSLVAQAELGRLVAEAGSRPVTELMAEYGPTFMAAMAEVATVKRHTNVLQHVQGFFKSFLGSTDKAELVEVIEEYRLGRVPLVVPLTLFRHHLRHHQVPEWLHQQTYLNPYPRELMLRNHV